jgi:hypothetical protein
VAFVIPLGVLHPPLEFKYVRGKLTVVYGALTVLVSIEGQEFEPELSVKSVVLLLPDFWL